MPEKKKSMTELTARDYGKILESLREIYSLNDLDEFPSRLLNVVSKIIKAQVINYTELDPVLGRSTSYFHPPITPGGFTGESVAEPFQRNIQDHPVIRYIEKTRDASAHAISDFLTAEQFRSTGLYREVFKPMGLSDQLSVGMVGSGGLMIGVTINRTRRGFSARDRTVLNLLRPHIHQAYVNCRERHTSARRTADRHATIMDQLPLGLICVDANGRVLWSTSTAGTMLRAHYPDAADSIHGLPDAVRYWLKKASAKKKKGDGDGSYLRSLRPGFELHVRYCPLNDGRAILLLQEPPLMNEKPSMENFGFTKREQQVAQHVITGDSISKVAGDLQMSPRTVQKHLERIFRKLRVNNLASACVKMLKM